MVGNGEDGHREDKLDRADPEGIGFPLFHLFYSSIFPPVWVLRSSAPTVVLAGFGQWSLPLAAPRHSLQGKPESEEVAGKGWSCLAGPVPTGPSRLSATPSAAIGHAREAAASLGWCQ